MQIYIDICLYTNGDFSLRNCKYNCVINQDEENYFISKVVTGDNVTQCVQEAKALLQYVLCDIRVRHEKYLLLDTLCKFFGSAITNFLFKKNYRIELGGDYVGTSIDILIVQ